MTVSFTERVTAYRKGEMAHQDTFELVMDLFGEVMRLRETQRLQKQRVATVAEQIREILKP